MSEASVSTPDKGMLFRVLRSMIDDNQFSAGDIQDLQKHNLFVPLFVYGNEQKEFSEAFLLRGALRVGVGVTADKVFLMSRNETHINPVVFRRPHAPTAARIYGELYLVNPEIIIDLDQTYERGIFHRRLRQDILYYDPTDQKKEPFLTSAFIYLGIYEAFEARIQAKLLTIHTQFIEHWSNLVSYRWWSGDDQPNRERLKTMREITNQRLKQKMLASHANDEQELKTGQVST